MTKRLHKALLTFTAATLPVFITTDAMAGLYGSVKLGVSKLDMELGGDDLDTNVGVSAAGALGYEFVNLVRVEAEGRYTKNGVDEPGLEGDAEVVAISGNAYVDIPYLGFFKPYVGAGVGGALVALDLTGLNDEDFVFEWHVIAGLRSSFDGNMTFTAEYRYTDFEDTTLGGMALSGQSHSLYAGVRIPF